MTDKELLQQALDALSSLRVNDYDGYEISYHDAPIIDEAIKAIRARLSQCDRCGEVNPAEIHTCTPKREWVGLTEDEVAQAMYRADAIFTGPMQFKFAKEVEAKLKEKNG